MKEAASAFDSVVYKKRECCALQPYGCTTTKNDLKFLLTVADHETQLGSFDIVKCTQCDVALTNPYPTEETVSYLYQGRSTADFHSVNNTLIDTIKSFLARRLIKKITRNRTVESVLDYGTGNGVFACETKVVLPTAEVVAMDYHETLPPLLHDENQIRYVKYADFASELKKYDLIIVRHVLEHTHDPIAVLQDLKSRLSPKGIIYIEVPNLNSACGKLFGKYWRMYYVPRHIFHFSKNGLHKIASFSGLRAKIGKTNMPMMSCMVSILSGVDQSLLWVKLIGILLHPVQLLTEAVCRSSTCLYAICEHEKK